MIQWVVRPVAQPADSPVGYWFAVHRDARHHKCFGIIFRALFKAVTTHLLRLVCLLCSLNFTLAEWLQFLVSSVVTVLGVAVSQRSLAAVSDFCRCAFQRRTLCNFPPPDGCFFMAV